MPSGTGYWCVRFTDLSRTACPVLPPSIVLLALTEHCSPAAGQASAGQESLGAHPQPTCAAGDPEATRARERLIRRLCR